MIDESCARNDVTEARSFAEGAALHEDLQVAGGGGVEVHRVSQIILGSLLVVNSRWDLKVEV